jgi:hypothetical protein
MALIRTAALVFLGLLGLLGLLGTQTATRWQGPGRGLWNMDRNMGHGPQRFFVSSFSSRASRRHGLQCRDPTNPSPDPWLARPLNIVRSATIHQSEEHGERERPLRSGLVRLHLVQHRFRGLGVELTCRRRGVVES